MDWNPLSETVCRMDAASERTWTCLQRVSGNGFQSMSLITADKAKASSTSALKWFARKLTAAVIVNSTYLINNACDK